MQVAPPREILLPSLGYELEGLSNEAVADLPVKLAEFRLTFCPQQVDDDGPVAGEEVNVRRFVVVRVNDHPEGAFSVDGGQRSAPYSSTSGYHTAWVFAPLPVQAN